MALRGTAMTAPLGQQGEPLVLPLGISFGHNLFPNGSLVQRGLLPCIF